MNVLLTQVYVVWATGHLKYRNFTYGVEQDVALPDLGEGISVLKQFDGDACLRALDARRHDRLAHLQSQIFANEIGRLHGFRIDHDVGKGIARTGHDIDHGG